MEVGTHPQSYQRALITLCSRKLHAMLDHDLLLVISSLFGFTILNASENTKTHILVIKLGKYDAHLYVNNISF